MTTPRANFADYTIVLATPEQIVQHAKSEHVPWGRGRDFPRFYDEQVTRRRTGPWAKDDALLTWVLVKRNDPFGEVYAGCETYRRSAYIKDKDGKISPGHMYGIASVVTPLAHRRNGYGTHMLSLLHYMLAPTDHMPPFPSAWGAPPPALPVRPEQAAPEGQSYDSIQPPPASLRSDSASFLDATRPEYLPAAFGSILWSDVGSQFYSKCTVGPSAPGWVMEADDNLELKWKLSGADDSALEGWEVLYRKDLPSVSHTLSAASKEELSNAAPGSWLADAQTPGLIDFTPLRNMWSDLDLRPRLDTLPVGLRRTQHGNEAIVLFATQSSGIAPALLITALHNVTPAILPDMLDALDVMGRKEGRDEGLVWGLRGSGELADAWRKLRTITADGPRPEKDGHLLGVAWYGKAGEARGRLLDTQMWGWC